MNRTAYHVEKMDCAAEERLVHLVQARLGPDHFAYIAVARPKPGPAGAALSMRLLEAA